MSDDTNHNTKNNGARLGRSDTGSVTHVLTTANGDALCSRSIVIVFEWWSDFFYDPEYEKAMCEKCKRQVLAAAIFALQEQGENVLADQVRDAFRRSYAADARPS